MKDSHYFSMFCRAFGRLATEINNFILDHPGPSVTAIIFVACLLMASQNGASLSFGAALAFIGLPIVAAAVAGVSVVVYIIAIGPLSRGDASAAAALAGLLLGAPLGALAAAKLFIAMHIR